MKNESMLRMLKLLSTTLILLVANATQEITMCLPHNDQYIYRGMEVHPYFKVSSTGYSIEHSCKIIKLVPTDLLKN